MSAPDCCPSPCSRIRCSSAPKACSSRSFVTSEMPSSRARSLRTPISSSRTSIMVDVRDELIGVRNDLARELGISDVTKLRDEQAFGAELQRIREQGDGQQSGADIENVQRLIEVRAEIKEQEARIASLEGELEALRRDPTLEAEQARLVERWHEHFERERAAKQRLQELSGTVHVHEFKGAAYERAVLARLREAQE